MACIYDKIYIEEFGECRGVGRCGTCHISIKEAPDLLSRTGVENTTLGRLDQVTENSRLACQILITRQLQGLVGEVVESESLAY